MAHAVYEIDGEFSMAYTGEKPWHGLGQKIPANAPLTTWMKKSHLDFQVISTPATYFHPTTGDVHLIPERNALLRDDNGWYLSTVSDRYKITQPKDVLFFFDDLIKKGGFKMETAGSLFYGRRIWALASIQEKAKILNNSKDIIKGYLLLASSCDGSLANVGRFTSVRVVCNNTLSMAIPNRKKGNRDVRIPHNTEFDPEKIKVELGLAKDTFKAHVGSINKMAKKKLPMNQAVEFFIQLFQKGGEKDNQVKDLVKDSTNKKGQVINLFEKIKEVNEMPEVDLDKVPPRVLVNLIQLFEKGAGQNLKTSKGTVWGAVNSVSEFVDHHRKSQSIDHKLNSAWFGKGQNLKNKAWDLAVKKAA